jgi:ribonuclease Y
MSNFVYFALAGMAAGYIVFIFILKILPNRLKADQKKQRDEILKDARQVAQQRRQAEAERLESDLQMLSEQLDIDIQERTEDLKMSEEDLDARGRSIELEEARVQKLEKDVESKKARTDASKEAYEVKVKELLEMREELKKSLETTADVDARALVQSIQDNLIESRQRENTKALKFFEEEVESNSKRIAVRAMARAMARYSPDFYWPKSVNFVEIEDQKLAEKLAAEGQPLLQEMKEKAEIEVELLAGPDHQFPIIKLAGGAGVNREAVRLAMTDILSKGQGAWSKAAATYDKFRAQIEQDAIVLGRKAIREVQLEGIHPEIQKLVGYLNWRTSYRQNQWYHTVEVAKLAGILAHEVGCDPDQAKRVGLLHDIGKALDYRIEGSHAVISADYADRYGERRLICDTVMSHHNDLLVETPLAYVLRTADTLSGARPGARVNLEEGYQIRLSGIEGAVRSFPGVMNISIMNGGREVHVEVNHKRVQDHELEALSQGIARKIEQEVAFPGEIKILVSRRFEAMAVA